MPPPPAHRCTESAAPIAVTVCAGDGGRAVTSGAVAAAGDRPGACSACHLGRASGRFRLGSRRNPGRSTMVPRRKFAFKDCFFLAALCGLAAMSIFLSRSKSVKRKSDRPGVLHPDASKAHTIHNAAVGNIVGFFNMFASNIQLFEEVITEQINTLENSKVLGQVAAVHYAYFGPNFETFAIPSTSPKYIKSNISYSAGGELSTLEILHKHCVKNPNDRVFYIHSKGSFSPHEENTLLRQNLMKSVVYCLNSTDILVNNDLCGFKFSPIPYPQIAGPTHDGAPPRHALTPPCLPLAPRRKHVGGPLRLHRQAAPARRPPRRRGARRGSARARPTSSAPSASPPSSGSSPTPPLSSTTSSRPAPPSATPSSSSGRTAASPSLTPGPRRPPGSPGRGSPPPPSSTASSTASSARGCSAPARRSAPASTGRPTAARPSSGCRRPASIARGCGS